MKHHSSKLISAMLVLAMLLSMVSPAFAIGSPSDSDIVITNTTVNGVTYDADGNVIENQPEPEPSILPDNGFTDGIVSPTVTPEVTPAIPEPSVTPTQTPEASVEPTVSPSIPPEVQPSMKPVEPPEAPEPEVSETPGVPDVSNGLLLDARTSGIIDVGSGSRTLTPGTMTLTGTTKTNRMTLSGSGTYNITFNDLTIDFTAMDDVSCLDIKSGMIVNLTLVGTSTLTAGVGSAGIRVPVGAELHIISGGVLNVTGGSPTATSSRQESGAGIGGNYKETAGKIYIQGGTIVATGGPKAHYGAAGIGGGSATTGITSNADGKRGLTYLEITGGNVTATGSANAHYGAAGIGGGSFGNGNNIVINGGIVTAKGSPATYYGASGIGGGAGVGVGTGGIGYDIHIGGNAKVTATPSTNSLATGAGIGGGYGGDGHDITVSGGNVATHSDVGDNTNGAAIGGGGDGDGYNLKITGGTSTLRPGSRGAGIGGGSNGYGQDITISGGTVNISATTFSGGVLGGAGIGGGSDGYGKNIVINSDTGSVTLEALGGRGGAGIGGGINGDGSDITITGDVNINAGGNVTSSSNDGGAGIGGGAYGDGVNISISGANVRLRATGSGFGAGIGGGSYRTGVNISIKDCTRTDVPGYDGYAIYANGNSYGAGIGSGGGNLNECYTGSEQADVIVPNSYSLAANISIDSSNVWVNGSHGAGIGFGYNNEGDSGVKPYADINIVNSKLHAYSQYGAGVGSGYDMNSNNESYADQSWYAKISMDNTVFDGSAYAASAIGSGSYSYYGRLDITIKNSSSVSAIVTGRQNSWQEAGAGIGTGHYNYHVDTNIDISDIETLTATSAYSGAGVGAGSYNQNGNIVVSVTNCNNVTLGGGTSDDDGGVGFGLGYNNSKMTGSFTMTDVDTLSIPKGSHGIGTGGGGGNNNKLDMLVERVGAIDIAVSRTGIGSGQSENGVSGDLKIIIQNCGNISVSSKSYLGVGIGSGYNNRENKVSVHILNNGNVTVLRSSSSDGESSQNASYGGAAFGTGANSYKMSCDIQVIGNKDIKAQSTSYNTAAIGTGSGNYDLSLNIAMRSAQPGVYSLTTSANHFGTNIGSGYQTRGTSADKTVVMNVNIALENYKSIAMSSNNSHSVGIGIGWSSSATRDGNFVQVVDVKNCGDITYTASNVYCAGIGPMVANGPVHNSAVFTDCGDVVITGSGSSNYFTGIGVGYSVSSSVQKSVGSFINDITFERCGDITVDAPLWGWSVGIGSGVESNISNNAFLKNAVSILNCGNVTANVGAYGTAIGGGSGVRASSSEFITDILIENCGDVTATGSYDSVAIGQAGYWNGNNAAAQCALNIDILNSGHVVANGSNNTGNVPLNNGNGWGTGIGLGRQYNGSNGNNTVYPIAIDIIGCQGVEATGSRSGAAIGTGYAVNYNTGLSITIDSGDVTATAGEYAPAIGMGQATPSGNKGVITVKNATVTATSGKSAVIGFGQGGQSGEAEIILDSCVINGATQDGPLIGFSRDNQKNKLIVLLTDCTADFTGTGYSAGIGQGLSNIGTTLDLTITGGEITVAGSGGGAGIGIGPVNTGCSLALAIDGNAIVNATGSGSAKNEFEVLGSVGNSVLDDLAKLRPMGAGAGIGGANGSHAIGINIKSGTVTANGGSLVDYCAAGIGSGRNGSGPAVTISGGTVNAHGGACVECGAAGIGGGVSSHGGNIIIKSANPDAVTMVTAVGCAGEKLGGAGIGGGPRGDAGVIEISGNAVIHATGSSRGAGIGGGFTGSGGDIKILSKDGHNPVVTATGGLFDSSAIGFGASGAGGKLTLSGAPVIKAYAKSNNPALGIEPEDLDTTKLTTSLFQGTLASLRDQASAISIETKGTGLASTQVELPANYAAFSATVPNTGVHNIYLTTDKRYLLATALDNTEDFDLITAKSSEGKQLDVIRFFDITFNTNGGSNIATQSVRVNNKITIPAEPSRNNDIFAGWYSDAELNVPYDFSLPVTADTTLYAKWIAIEGKPYVIYHYKANLEGGYDIGSIEYGGAKPGVLVTANPIEYTGFMEDKTNPNRLATGYTADGTTLELRLYYVRRDVSVDIENANGYATDNKISAPYGSLIVLGKPAKEGYDFTQWTSGSADGPILDVGLPIRIETMGSVIFANWVLQEGRAAYQIKHYLRSLDGSYELRVAEDLSGDVGDTVTVTPNAYTGFHVNKSISDETATGVIQQDNSLALRVYYDRDLITVKLVDTYNTEPTVSSEYGSAANLPTPSRPGYIFNGWKRADGTICKDGDKIETMGEAVTAQWTAGATIAYTVRYWQQDVLGKDMEIVVVEDLQGLAGSKATAAIKDYTGFVFDAKASNITGIISADSYLVLNLYYTRNTYGVTYDSKSGSSVASQSGIYHGALATEPTVPVKTGYEFGGWYLDEDCGSVFNFLMPIHGNLVLYAKWMPGESGYKTQHWVEDTSGVYTMRDEVEAIGITDSTITAAHRSYTGCVANGSHPDGISSGKIVSDGSLVLKVYYSLKPVTVIYVANNGTDIPSQVLKYGSLAEDVKPEYAGYSFNGWYTNPLFKTKFDFTKPVIKDQVLYAKWTAKTDTAYSVEYYWQNVNPSNTYTLHETVQLTGTTDKLVSAKILDYNGFTQDRDNANTSLAAILAGDGSTVLKVYYNRENVTVKFEANGGVAVKDLTMLFGDTIGNTATVKVGYDFAGWYTDKALSGAWDKTSPVDADMTLWAKWSPSVNTKYTTEHYTQNKDQSGYVKRQVDTLTGTTDAMATAEALSNLYGYAENETHADRVVSAEIQPDGSTVLKLYYDRVSYQVSFESNGGTETESLDVVYEQSAAKPTDPEKTGYVFAGWYQDAVFTKAFDFKTAITSNVKLYAKWTPASGVTYKVEYYQSDADGVYSEKTSETQLAGTTGNTVRAEVPEIDGFVYDGKATGTSHSGVVAADGSLVLSVYYKRLSFKVNFNYANGKPASNITVAYGMPVELPGTEKAGYDFVGWFTADGNQIGEYYRMPSHDVSMTARYSVKDGTIYKVQHWQESLTGSYVLAQTDELTGTTEATVTAAVLEADGFVENKTHEKRVASGVIAGDGTLVLALYYSRLSYDVVFESNGGTKTDSQIVLFKDQVVAPADPVKTGWVFDGWWLEDDFQTEVLFAIYPVVKNVVIYAKWLPAQDTKYVTKHYQQTVAGDNYVLAQTDEFTGITGGTTAATAATYYGFVENKTHADRVPEITIQPDGTSVMKLYYDRLSYQVSFESNGGTEIKPVSTVYQGHITAPVNPKKTGYIFAGWYSDGIYSKPVDPAAIQVTENVTVYAKWQTAQGTGYRIQYYLADLAGHYNLVSTEAMTGETGITVEAQTRTVNGYTMNPDAPDAVLSGIIAADGSLVLKVYYDRVLLNVTIDPDNDSDIISRQVKFEAKLGELPVVTKKDCEFAGWYDTEGRVITESSIVTKDMGVIAHWTEKPIVIPPEPPVVPPAGGGGGGGSIPAVYEISVKVTDGGRIDPDKAVIEISAGRSQLIKIMPDAGYAISDVIIDGKSHGAISQYVFEKVKENHAIEVKFVQTSTEHNCYIDGYIDVNLDAWYHGAFDWAVAETYFQGVTDKTLMPLGTLSRSQAAMVIARMYEYQSDSGLSGLMAKPMFSDVALDAWYAEAVHWDADRGYMVGYSDGRFGSDDPLTREQMALALYRLHGMPVAPSEFKKKFEDMDEVSTWAWDAMSWAIESNIIAGDDKNRLKPQAAITRAEAAAMFQRFQELNK